MRNFRELVAGMSEESRREVAREYRRLQLYERFILSMEPAPVDGVVGLQVAEDDEGAAG